MYFNVVYSARFFKTPSECIQNFYAQSRLTRLVSLVKSFARFFFITLPKTFYFGYLSLRNPFNKYAHIPSSPTLKNKLIVCLNGVGGSPNQFKSVIKLIEKKESSNTQIYVPKILNRGLAKTDDIVAPIFKEIHTWIAQRKNPEIVLIGISNGSRLARVIDAKLIQTKAPIKQINTISIIGANQGSYLMNIVKKIPLFWPFLSKALAEEMPVGSPFNERLNQQLSTLSSCGIPHRYTFLAGPHDWIVPNYSSTLMPVPEGIEARYALMPGYGHGELASDHAEMISDFALS